MPTRLQGDDIADLVIMTERELGRFKWTDLTSDWQRYHAMPQILKKKKAKTDSGYGHQFNVMKTTTGNARHTGLYAETEVNTGDVMMTGTVPWRHSLTAYAYDLREISMNKSPSKILDTVKVKRADAMIDMANLFEVTLWNTPTSSTDNETPYGLKSYAVASATTGFNGGNPTFASTAGVCGIDSATWARWRNWTARWTGAITREGPIRLMKRAHMETDFVSPIDIPDYSRGIDCVIYVGRDLYLELGEYCEGQNESLGNDLASKEGRVTFFGNPIRWVPYWNDDTTYPMAFIDWGAFYPVFLDDWWMKVDGPKPSPHQHNVMQVFVDCTWNFVCRDRRRLAWIYKY